MSPFSSTQKLTDKIAEKTLGPKTTKHKTWQGIEMVPYKFMNQVTRKSSIGAAPLPDADASCKSGTWIKAKQGSTETHPSIESSMVTFEQGYIQQL